MNMHYLITPADEVEHFIGLRFTIPNIHQDFIEVQLPAWRPGRYELQNFAKNVRWFEVKQSNGEPVQFEKITKDRWRINTININEVIITYQYYANQPDAGACYIDEHYLYINPVHCFMYVEGRIDEPYIIDFNLPEDVVIATQLEHKGKHQLFAPNFDYLADSPLIASANLQHDEVNIEETTLHFWFQGEHTIDLEQLKRDTVLYTRKQIEVFGELPCGNYHFLYIIHPYPARHGVEHLNSTVIVLGKSEEQTALDFYNDLLAISSHELFHLWNIKRIRPQTMLPYDFTKENYSTLGYIYEGVTTYYGDLMLLQSGVWSLETYFKSLADDFKRHIQNTGRFHYSVAESSWDTWLDGYVIGVKGRKVSIYIEGMIAALIADILILHASDLKYSLHDVMKALYERTYKKERGYTEEDWFELLNQFSGMDMSEYTQKVIYGHGNWDRYLLEVMHLIGCEITVGDDGQVTVKPLVQRSVAQENLFAKWTSLR